MVTTIILVLVGLAGLGICIWSWRFENGTLEEPSDTEQSAVLQKKSNK